MIQTLEKMGLGLRMLDWIRTLYRSPTAKIKVNGSLSESFIMKNGTRQGCPLSPLLFVLSLGPFLAKIRKNVDIEGVKTEEEEHKLSAFADDVLFYLVNPITSIPKLLILCKQYGEISNFKLNVTKT